MGDRVELPALLGITRADGSHLRKRGGKGGLACSKRPVANYLEPDGSTSREDESLAHFSPAVKTFLPPLRPCGEPHAKLSAVRSRLKMLSSAVGFSRHLPPPRHDAILSARFAYSIGCVVFAFLASSLCRLYGLRVGGADSLDTAARTSMRRHRVVHAAKCLLEPARRGLLNVPLQVWIVRYRGLRLPDALQ